MKINKNYVNKEFNWIIQKKNVKKNSNKTNHQKKHNQLCNKVFI